jgi:RNA polymerase sigma factor (sigma-70 family)
MEETRQMPANPFGLLLRQVRTLVPDEGDSDGALLARFVERREEDAFAALVRRHGPLVLGLCRRWLGNLHDAEDVFQATFLVLARKAASVRKRQSLASFLHGVALRLAARIRAHAVRWRHFAQASDLMHSPNPLDRLSVRELQQGLDEELQRLPERYRAPLLLCFLQGRTQVEAARELGWSKGTLRRRLACGRDLLRARLVGRGLSLASFLGVPLLSASLSASASAGLIERTVTAAHAPAAVSPTVAALVETALRALAPFPVRMVLLGALAVSLLVAVALGPVPQAAPDAGKSSPTETTPAAPQPDDPLPEGTVARLGTKRGRCPAPVLSVLFTPNRQALLTSGEDDSIRFWDPETGRLVRRMAREDAFCIYGLSVGADGRKLAAVTNREVPLQDGLCTHDWVIDLWDPVTGRRTDVLRSGSALGPAALAPDGKTLAWVNLNEGVGPAQENYLWLRDLTGQRPPRPIESPAFDRVVRTSRGALSDWWLQFSPDGRLLAAGGRYDSDRIATGKRYQGGLRCARGVRPPEGYPVWVWDVATGKCVCTLSGDEGMSSCLAYTPDSKGLATGSWDGAVKLWDLVTGKVRRTLRVPAGGVACLALAPDGKTVTAGARDASPLVLAWDLDSGRESYRVPLLARQLAYSPDGRRLAVVDEDNVVHVLDARTGRPLFAPPGHTLPVETLVFSPDGKELVSADETGRVYRWDPTSGRSMGEHAAGAGPARWLAYAADGTLLTADAAGAEKQASLRVWEVATGQVRSRVALKTGESWQVAPDGSRALVYTPGPPDPAQGSAPGMLAAAQVWDLGKARPVVKLNEPIPNHRGVFSPNCKLLATIMGQVQVWDLTTGRNLPHLTVFPAPPPGGTFACTPVAFSADGQLLAISHHTGLIQLLDVATGKERSRLVASDEKNPLWTLAFSRDSRLLATAAADRSVRLWDVASGMELRRFTGHEGVVQSLAFAPDGKTLASGSADTTILIWDVAALVR